MLLVVDSSIWVSSFMTNETNHALADQFVLDAVQGEHRIVVPTIFINEVICSLSRRFAEFERDRNFLEDVAETIWNSSVFSWKTVDRQLAREAAVCGRLYRLRGMDAIFAATALYYQLPLLTEDKEFSRTTEVIRILRLKDIVH